VGFEYADPPLGDQGATDPPDELLALPAEHHSGHDFDPSDTLVVHAEVSGKRY
jgi:hypothetical protein